VKDSIKDRLKGKAHELKGRRFSRRSVVDWLFECARPITARCTVQQTFPRVKALLVASVAMSAMVLTPIAVVAAALGAWRFCTDLGWTSNFFIPDGLLSRYQVWFGAAIGARASALILNRWEANRTAERHIGA
jgi:hypothetical protein